MHHQLIVYHLKHTDTPLPGRVRALWKMTSLGEYTATWFFWNIGAHRNTDEEAIAVKGQYAAVCGGTGCSIFIVVNANYFGEVRAPARTVQPHTSTWPSHTLCLP